MSTSPSGAPPHTEAPLAAAFAPEAGVGTPLAVGAFGFSVLMLGIPSAGLIDPDAVGAFAAGPGGRAAGGSDRQAGRSRGTQDKTNG